MNMQTTVDDVKDTNGKLMFNLWKG